MCIFSYQKSINGSKSIFHEYDQKIIKYFAKKNVSVFKDAIFGIFEHTKFFFGKMFHHFFYRIHEWFIHIKIERIGF